MIKNINAIGKYMTVTGAASQPYINNYSGQAQGVGNMRFNTGTQSVEVYDGSSWVSLSSNYSSTGVGLTTEAEMLLDWARDRRQEELERKALAEKHPAVAEALELLKQAEERVKIVTALTKELPVEEQA